MRVKVLDSFCCVFVDWLANLILFHTHRAVKEKWSQHEATSAVLMFLNEKQETLILGSSHSQEKTAAGRTSWFDAGVEAFIDISGCQRGSLGSRWQSWDQI